MGFYFVIVFYSNCNHRTGCGVTSIWQLAPGERESKCATGTSTREWAAPGQLDLDVSSSLSCVSEISITQQNVPPVHTASTLA